MINYTDTQLKQALAKMLPEDLYISKQYFTVSAMITTQDDNLCWTITKYLVKDTELLHLCWLAEETLFMNTVDWAGYSNLLIKTVARTSHNTFPSVYLHATWQQRVIALCKVKGVEIV